MRLAIFVIYVFFLSATGLTAQSTFSDDIFFNDINSRHGWDSPGLGNDEFRNFRQTDIDSHSVTTKRYLFDDHFLDKQPEIVLLGYDYGETKQLIDVDNKWTKHTGTGYHAMYAKAEISITDGGNNGELAKTPSPSNRYYHKVVSWIKDTYQAWVAKDRYGSARLVLLSFGLVGLIGIRRKFKKRG